MQAIPSTSRARVALFLLGREIASAAAWTVDDLAADSESYRGTGGVSEENGELGFRPAFLDSGTGNVYRSRFHDGTPAPFHLLDGLPDDLVLSRNEYGRVAAVRASLVSGFVRCGRFYTREEAAAAVAEIPCAA